MAVCLASLQGCAGITGILGQDPNDIESNFFLVDKKTSVIGKLATMEIEQNDTLPDIARHFSLGINTLSAANPDVDIWVPDHGKTIILPLSYILPDTARKGIVINLPALRLFHYKKQGSQHIVSTFPIGAGAVDRATPMGNMHITRKKHLPTWYVPASIAADHLAKGDPLPSRIPPGPLNPLGEYALYLSKPSYLIHGTNKPASVGLRASNGCIRLLPEDIQRLFKITSVKTPVKIVNQPYLLGQRDGIVYLEAHTPFNDLGKTGLKKIYLQLNELQKKNGFSFDWDKIEAIVAKAQGIPIAISSTGLMDKTFGRHTIRLKHPAKLRGQPQVPELKSDAWYVLAAVMDSKTEARRLSAIINHQGPQIPTRVMASNNKNRVLSGPFKTKGEAVNALHRLHIDLNLNGILVAP
ncbi:L,D-transpeptidase family protein [Desulfogranum japonicum]|uniref:L,D-transpeptidase family protein n=1 Tax=Desulfogranum japonicum TaxID=231447 RepID=UPI0003FB3C4C|nr:L,D-transpeptidase family protein [Desulfogranum japonicum]